MRTKHNYDIVRLGYIAFDKGVSNPYSKDTECWYDWQLGWYYAEQDNQSNNTKG